jgi:N6-adenosine-specific RNA methylase IME4
MDSKKYQVIYADPPWNYKGGKELFIQGVRWKHASKQRNIDKKRREAVASGEREPFTYMYPTLSKEDLKSLNVPEIADKDCVLFMWIVDAHLLDALEIIKAWGFKYSTIAFVWKKLTSRGNPVHVMSPWTHKSCEICLVATKGSPSKYRKDKTVRQLIEEERIRHSQKPQEVADRIVRMFPTVNRIELFARDAKPGWDVWGNEIQNTIEL